MLEDVVKPRGPYRLNLMTFGRAYETPLPGGKSGLAWQLSDGRVELRAPDEEALATLRFCLALEADTTEFLRRFRSDPVVGPSIRRLYGFRPLRRPTVARAALHAICGQLVDVKTAFTIERRIMDAIGDHAPTREPIGRLSPAELRRFGLATQRASALIRICRTIDLEALRDRPLEGVEARLLRERGLGPWSLGVISLHGIGSYRYGLVGDLTLVKLCSALWGRWVESYETAELLAPYEEWAGLAGAYLMKGSQAGLVPGGSEDRARLVRSRAA